MFRTIDDRQVILEGGMGWGAFNCLRLMGIKPILTDILEKEKATHEVINGTNENHLDRYH